MAKKPIDLEFTVANGGSQILRDLENVKSKAEGSDEYTGLNYHLTAQSRSQIESELKSLAKSVDSVSQSSSSSATAKAVKQSASARKESAQAAEKEAAATKQAQQATERATKATRENARAKKESVNDSQKMNSIEIQMSTYAQKYGANISKNITLQAKFNELLGKVQRKEIGAKEAAQEWSQYRVECKRAGVEVQTLGQKVSKLFGDSFKQRAKFLISTSALRAARQMVTDIKDIDAAMTELRKVTDETSETYNQFMTNAGSRAKDIGATMSDVIKATADFARLGYNIPDASKLADAAIVLKNVGDGITDIDDASEKIISVVKAFPEFEGNAMSVVDKMNEVGNNYAISSSGIAEALQRSAGALTAANNTLDESIALAVGMNAVTQDPAKVGGQ